MVSSRAAKARWSIHPTYARIGRPHCGPQDDARFLNAAAFYQFPIIHSQFGIYHYLPRTWGTLHAPASTLPCRTAGTTRRGGHPTDPASRSAAGPRETAARAAHPNQFAPSNPHHPPHFSLLTRPLYPEKGPSSRYFRSFVRYSDTRTNVSSPFGSVVSSLRQSAKSAGPTANSWSAGPTASSWAAGRPANSCIGWRVSLRAYNPRLLTTCVILSRGDSRVPKDLLRPSLSKRKRSFDSAPLHSG